MELTRLDDESLLRLIAHRQENALSALYDRYGRLVYSIGLNVLGDSAAAEEVTQDVFLRVWANAATYQAEHGKVVNWLTSIARNRAIDLYRSRNIRQQAGDIEWEEEIATAISVDGGNIEQLIEFEQQRRRVRNAIAQLPVEQQETLILAYFYGFSHQEIADRLNQPLGTVKTRVRLAMQKLKKILVD